jgi:FkbM family methyltransferase
MQLPLSHRLPMYLRRHPYYGKLPKRLGAYIRAQFGNLCCVDVGANIGDSLAAFYQKGTNKDRYLEIEPHPLFFKYLYANWGRHNNVKLINCLCSGSNITAKYQILEKGGTASFVKTEKGIEIESKTLDTIVNDLGKFPSVNVIKIDTDGNDFKVIAGAKELIAAYRPAVLFECQSSSNPAYVENCLETLNMFRTIGYSEFLLYDNFGYLIGKFSLADHSAFKKILFYQLVSKFYYFDILLLGHEDIESFYTSEVVYFIENMPQKWLQRSASIAAKNKPFAGETSV